MNYVVVDLEWNQAMNPQSSVFNILPIRLRGEIIEIGAVKLDENMCPTEEFQIDVKPVYFKRMHYKVKKLTGFDKERLANGVGFPEALAKFREWCGDGVTFLTWGYDDQGILEQNIIIHDLDWDWIAGWVNLQVIYNLQTDGARDQRSLATAMEHFGIEQTRVAHDALGDAYNTGLVCSKLDMVSGMERYEEALANMTAKTHRSGGSGSEFPEPLEHKTVSRYSSKAEAFADERVGAPDCPVCGGKLSLSRWVNQNGGRYMNLAECPQDGKFLVRMKFKRLEEGGYDAIRLTYPADEALTKSYTDRLSSPKKRRSRSAARKRKKKRNSKRGGSSEE